MDFDAKHLLTSVDELAPARPDIRPQSQMKGAGKISSSVSHHEVEEIWYLLERDGEVWRKISETEEVVNVSGGTNLTTHPRTAFQLRNTGVGPLHILIVTMPPCPDPQEAEKAVGLWLATVTPDTEQADVGKGRGES